MKEKFKFLVPLIFIGATVSCGQGNNVRLNRETYNDKIYTATSFMTKVEPLASKQFKEQDGKVIVQIPEQGTVKVNTSFNFATDKAIFEYHKKQSPINATAEGDDIKIDLSDKDTSTDNQIIVSWDISSNYLKIENKNVSTSYVAKEGSTWWNCVTPKEGGNYKINITNVVNAYNDFRNCVFDLTTHALSTELPFNDGNVTVIAGFDISGFIGSKTPEDICSNVLSPMSLLMYRDTESELPLSTYIDMAGVILESTGFSYCFNGSEDTSINAYCEQIGTGDFHLSDFKKFYDSETVQMILSYLLEDSGITINFDKCDGTANLDFFLNYKNNFIHQEEFIIDLKGINFDLMVDSTPYLMKNDDEDYGFTASIDVQNTDLSFVANQELTETSTVDKINFNDYPIKIVD